MKIYYAALCFLNGNDFEMDQLHVPSLNPSGPASSNISQYPEFNYSLTPWVFACVFALCREHVSNFTQKKI